MMIFHRLHIVSSAPLLALAIFLLSSSAAFGAATWTVDATTNGAGLNALVPGDTVTLDISVRASGLPVALGASVNDYDSNIVSLNSGASLLSDQLFVSLCPPEINACFGGIANLVTELVEQPTGPGIASAFFVGATSNRDQGDGMLDPGIVTGVSGDAQFRIVFDVLAPGMTTLQIGAFDEYGGAYFEEPGDTISNNTSVTLVVVPEPSVAMLLGFGLSALAVRRRV